MREGGKYSVFPTNASIAPVDARLWHGSSLTRSRTWRLCDSTRRKRARERERERKREKEREENSPAGLSAIPVALKVPYTIDHVASLLVAEAKRRPSFARK